MQLIHLISLLATIVQLSIIEAAPTEVLGDSQALEAPSSRHEMKPLVASDASIAGSHVEPAAAAAATAEVAAIAPTKLKRDSRAKVTSLELDTQETGYLPGGYQSADSDYGYDSGKNSYGKQASDWSLYDQGKFTGAYPLIVTPTFTT